MDPILTVLLTISHWRNSTEIYGTNEPAPKWTTQKDETGRPEVCISVETVQFRPFADHSNRPLGPVTVQFRSDQRLFMDTLVPRNSWFMHNMSMSAI